MTQSSDRAISSSKTTRGGSPPGRALRWCAEQEIWPVAAWLLAGAAAPRVMPVALGVAALFWLLRWAATGRLSVSTPGDPPIGLLVVMLGVSAWATAWPDVTRLQILRLLGGLALYYAIVNGASSPGRMRWLAWAPVAGGLALAAVALLTVQWNATGKLPFIPKGLYSRLPAAGGIAGDAVNANIMGGALVIVLPYVLARVAFRRPRAGWVAWSAALVVALSMAALLVLTKSRGALMGLGVAGLGIILLRWRRGWLLVVVAALAAAAVAWRIGPARILDTLAVAGSTSGLDGRLEIWSRALYMLQDFPFTGVGMGAFGKVANLLYPFFLFSPDTEVSHAHNLFLQVGVDLGLPGLVAWLALLLLTTVCAWQVYRGGRAAGDRDQAGIGAGLLACQVALLVHGLTDAPAWGSRPAIIVWGLWGLAVAARRVYGRRAAERAADVSVAYAGPTTPG
jgi:putative inorganic carbon (HCO3(-)) transporter